MKFWIPWTLVSAAIAVYLVYEATTPEPDAQGVFELPIIILLALVAAVIMVLLAMARWAWVSTHRAREIERGDRKK